MKGGIVSSTANDGSSKPSSMRNEESYVYDGADVVDVGSASAGLDLDDAEDGECWLPQRGICEVIGLRRGEGGIWDIRSR